jgi:GNAT superfamily N-acetyltransferase
MEREGAIEHVRIRHLLRTDYEKVSRIYGEVIREYLAILRKERSSEYRLESRSITRTIPFKLFEFYSEAGGSFVAVLDTKVVGFILAQPVQDLDGRAIWLGFVAVARGFRNRGVGLALLSSVKTWGAGQGIGRMFATLNPNNGASKALLNRAGFEVREWLAANYPPS